MRTTLLVNPELYRDAKAAAAREGMTLTRFIESALQTRLNLGARRAVALPVFDSGIGQIFDAMALIQAADADMAQDQLRKISAQ